MDSTDALFASIMRFNRSRISVQMRTWVQGALEEQQRRTLARPCVAHDLSDDNRMIATGKGLDPLTFECSDCAVNERYPGFALLHRHAEKLVFERGCESSAHGFLIVGEDTDAKVSGISEVLIIGGLVSNTPRQCGRLHGH